MTINELFSDLPKKEMNLYKKNASMSGKIKSDLLSQSNITVFLQTRKTDLITGVTAGRHYRAYIDSSILIDELNFGDKLKSDSTQYEIKGIELKDYMNDITPFYQLEIEKRN